MSNGHYKIEYYEKLFAAYEDFSFKEKDKTLVKRVLMCEIKTLHKKIAELTQKRIKQMEQTQEVLDAIEQAKRKIINHS